MADRCRRWVELTEHQLLGVELSARQIEQQRAHESECRECAAEAAILRGLGTPALSLAPTPLDVERILVQAEAAGAEAPTRRTRTLRRRIRRLAPLVAAAAAALACAAVAVLWLRASAPSKAQAIATPPSKDSLIGAVTEPTTTRTREDSCGALLEGIVLCLKAGTEVGRVQLAGTQRFVELKRGRAVAWLTPQPPGHSFSIVTATGGVTAVGTVFSVEYDGDRRAIARVARGKVLVRNESPSATNLLLAGQKMTLGESEATSLPAQEAGVDLDLVARFEALHQASSKATGAEQGEHARDPEPAATAPDGAQSPTKDELGYARSLRARGDFKGAAAVYRALHARSPNTEAGRAALMSLASLELTSLKDPRSALGNYDAYLSSGGGSLSQQAAYGRIRALRLLNRHEDAALSAKAFVARYPLAQESKLLKGQLASGGHP